VDGSTLRLTESGCGDGARIRCDVEYRIRVPTATATEITTEAGAVTLRGLDGRMSVTTGAGAVTGDRLTMADATVVTQAGATLLQFLKAPSTVRSESEVGAVEVRVPGTGRTRLTSPPPPAGRTCPCPAISPPTTTSPCGPGWVTRRWHQRSHARDDRRAGAAAPALRHEPNVTAAPSVVGKGARRLVALHRGAA
jgi:hypothetical protein